MLADFVNVLLCLLPLIIIFACLGTFYPVKNSSWTHSSTARTADRYSLDFKSEVIDTTNMTSSGYQTNEDGIFSCSGTYEGSYNGSTGLTQGQSATHTFAVGGGGPSFAIPFRVASIKLDGTVRNGVNRFAVTLESNGTYTVTI